MRLVFMGTPAFALPGLKALLGSPDHEVVAVYTAPPRPAHRGKRLTPSPVEVCAREHGAAVFTPTSFRDDAVLETLRSHNAQAAVVIAYGMLLPPTVLGSFPHGCINVHPSALPRWRGAAPIQRAIMAGDTTTDICIMQMDEGLDSGAVLLRSPTPIHPDETAGALHDRLAVEAAPLLLQALDGLEAGTLRAVPQAQEGVTYAKKISGEECLLDLSRPAAELACAVRGLSPSPGAYLMHEGERLRILGARARPLAPQEETVQIGVVLDEVLSIRCGEGALVPITVQRAGGRAMSVTEWLRGVTDIPECMVGASP